MPPKINIPLDRLEFHRHGLALLPRADDKTGGVAFLIGGEGNTDAQRFCSCEIARIKTCPHLLELSAVAKALARDTGPARLNDGFRNSSCF